MLLSSKLMFLWLSLSLVRKDRLTLGIMLVVHALYTALLYLFILFY
jgi:hypothetical protein